MSDLGANQGKERMRSQQEEQKAGKGFGKPGDVLGQEGQAEKRSLGQEGKPGQERNIGQFEQGRREGDVNRDRDRDRDQDWQQQQGSQRSDANKPRQ